VYQQQEQQQQQEQEQQEQQQQQQQQQQDAENPFLDQPFSRITRNINFRPVPVSMATNRTLQ
jgi:hypothetical protein